MRINLNLIIFAITFLMFAWDMEHTRTFMTWVYLMVAIISMALCVTIWTAEVIILFLHSYFKDTDNERDVKKA